MQTNAKTAQACFKASEEPHPPLKTPVQKDTPRETKKNIQLHYDQIKTIQEKTLEQKDTPREAKQNIQLVQSVRGRRCIAVGVFNKRPKISPGDGHTAKLGKFH